MDDGIGRSGVRLMALTFLTLGALGVLVFWNSTTDVLKWTATGVILASLCFLFLLIVSATRKEAARSAKPATPQPTPAVPIQAEDAAPIWEAKPEPLPRAAPAPTPPAAAKPEVDVAKRPTPRFEDPVEEPEARAHLRERYTQNTQLVKDILNPNAQAENVPRVVAQRWTPRMGDATPAGTTRGRCGQCSAIVIAPTARPIDLGCPVCEKVTRLNA